MFAGLAKLHLGEENEAIVWLRRSIETYRNYATSHFLLAAALARLGKLAEARSEVRSGLAMNPAFTIARVRSGETNENATVIAGQERIVDGLRKAGVPEQ